MKIGDRVRTSNGVYHFGGKKNLVGTITDVNGALYEVLLDDASTRYPNDSKTWPFWKNELGVLEDE